MIEKLNPEHENTAGHMAATTAAFQVRFLLRAVPPERHPDRARYATGRYPYNRGREPCRSRRSLKLSRRPDKQLSLRLRKSWNQTRISRRRRLSRHAETICSRDSG